jgi:hypothetical protein
MVKSMSPIPCIFVPLMKKLFLSFAFLFCLVAAHADTLDIYRVKFRGAQIAEFSEGEIIRLLFRTDSVYSNDSIFVDVIRDAPCNHCEYSMLIFGDKGPMLIDSTQPDQSFYIPLKPLIEYRRKNGTKEFHGYYTEYLDNKGGSRVISFRLIFE